MLIDNLLFEHEWYAILPLRLRFLYLYLLTKCTKTGVFEVNLRRMTYDMNDGKPVTRQDIFGSFGNRVQPLGESKGIFVDYIQYNWLRRKPFDPDGNPLHRGLANELAKYGLDLDRLNEMSNNKFEFSKEGDRNGTAACADTYRPPDKGLKDGGNANAKAKKFTPPTVEEVRLYCEERRNGLDPEEFVAFYESKGWRVGREPMKSWKSAVITWEKRREHEKCEDIRSVARRADNAIGGDGKSGIKGLF